MEIRFRIPMAAIYCAAVIFVLSLCGVCISQKVENERLERELSESRKKIRELERAACRLQAAAVRAVQAA